MSSGESGPQNVIPVPTEYAAPSWGHSSIPDILTRAREGDDNDLLGIAVFGNGEYMSMGAVQYVGQRLDETAQPHAWLHHRPLDLDQKQAMFTAVQADIEASLHSSEPVRPVKTVTLNIPGDISPYVAITGLGQKVNNPVKKAIAEDLNVSSKVVKGAKLNPSDFNTSMVLGQEPGVVGPFVTVPAAARIRAWFYVREENVSETAPVEVAMSSRDSLILQRQGFEELLESYNRDFLANYATIRCIDEKAA